MALSSEATRTEHWSAFMLMTYRSISKATLTEQVWNSRDGFAPDEIVMSDGSVGRYAGLRDDPTVPEHKPLVGSRIFVTMTPRHAREIASLTAAKFWRDGGAFGRAAQLHFRSELEVVSYVFDNLLMDISEGAPYIEIVTEDMAVARGWA